MCRTTSPMPRWCQPASVRTTRYKLDELSEAQTREIGRNLLPSNRRRAARKRSKRHAV